MTLSSSGALTLGTGAISSDGAVNLTGSTIATSANITTSSDTINFNSDTTLAGTIALNSAGGNITFNGTLNGTTAGAQSLTVAAGAGNLTLAGAVGNSRPLGNLNLTAASQLSAQGNITLTGDLTASADTIILGSGKEVRSTGGGTITLRPSSSGRAISMGTATGGLELDDTLTRIYTAGRVVVGQAGLGGSGAITLAGALDLSGQGYGGFSLLSNGADMSLASGSSLTLPNNTDVVFNLGAGGNVNDRNITGDPGSENPTLSAPGGVLRFTAKGVSLYADVAELQASSFAGGALILTEGSIRVTGSQVVGQSFGLGSLNGDEVTLQATIAADRTQGNPNPVSILLAFDNFYNLYGVTALNPGGGRGIVYSQSPTLNQPPTGNGGLSGFGAVYLQSNPDVIFGSTPGTFTLVNGPAGSGNVMAYYGIQPVSEMDPATLGQIVDVMSYMAAVPAINYSLPALYTGEIRVRYRTGAAPVPAAAPASNPAFQNGSQERLKVGRAPATVAPGQANAVSPGLGRLRVGQVLRAQEAAAGGSPLQAHQLQPMVRAGGVSLRMGEDAGWAMGEVTVSGVRISLR